MDEDTLAKIFEKFGARDPEQWARSQIAEGIPQLARFLFLKQAWNLVVGDNDVTWIGENAKIGRCEPGGAIGPALQRVLALGSVEKDLTAIVRVMQWRLLSGLCSLIDNPGVLEDEAASIMWRLFQVDQDDMPVAIIGGLDESVLDTDPTGREMRPD